MFLFLSQSRREEKSAKLTAGLRASRARSHLPSITQRQRTDARGVSGFESTLIKVVANLLKLIPGAGSAAGGAISSATAGILTTALGETYIFIMCAVFRGEMSTKDLETEEGKKKIKELFKEQLIISGKKRNA